jgi:hypothetical protein
VHAEGGQRLRESLTVQAANAAVRSIFNATIDHTNTSQQHDSVEE